MKEGSAMEYPRRAKIDKSVEAVAFHIFSLVLSNAGILLMFDVGKLCVGEKKIFLC